MYAVGIGWDVAQEELVPVHCRNGEVRATQRQYSDGGPHDQGLYSAPVIDLFEDAANLQETFALFGLDEAEAAKVTWYTRDDTFTWRRYNGWAKRPRPVEDGGLNNYFLRDYVIYIVDLQAVEDEE